MSYVNPYRVFTLFTASSTGRKCDWGDATQRKHVYREFGRNRGRKFRSGRIAKEHPCIRCINTPVQLICKRLSDGPSAKSTRVACSYTQTNHPPLGRAHTARRLSAVAGCPPPSLFAAARIEAIQMKLAHRAPQLPASGFYPSLLCQSVPHRTLRLHTR
jgi:hypothetical protein